MSRANLQPRFGQFHRRARFSLQINLLHIHFISAFAVARKEPLALLLLQTKTPLRLIKHTARDLYLELD